MGHQGFNRQWATYDEGRRRQNRGRGRRGPGPWGEWGGGLGGRQGPPPWIAGLFGLGQLNDQGRGPRVRRGDVRSAILDVLREAESTGEPVNGYQVIQQIAERSGGAWRPSPGSVYPTIQQLQDEGLVDTDDSRGRKALVLTEDGRTYLTEHAEELAAVWAPFDRQGERRDRDDRARGFHELKPEIGQVMGAVWQIVTAGSEAQQRAAIDVLVETRRKLYGILADGHGPEDEDEDADQTGES